MTNTNFPSYPLAAWACAAPTFLLALAFAATALWHQSDETFRAAALIAVILPVFICCAAWLATRPAYDVSVDKMQDAVTLTQTWPVRRGIVAVKASSIAAVNVQRANTDEGLAYSVVAHLRDGSELALSAEIISHPRATQLASMLRSAIGI